MIYLTTAHNDRDLVRYLAEANPVPIPHGDFIFQGVAVDEKGESLYRVCGERKKAMDLVQCINDGRHIKQVRDAFNAKPPFTHYFLVIETISRLGPDGEFEYRTGTNWTRTGMAWNRVMSYLNQLSFLMGVHIYWSNSPKMTAEIVRSVYNFFQVEEHHSLKKFHSPDVTLLTTPSLLRTVAKELPGIGWERSLAIEQSFPTVREMINATEKDWQEVDGIGKVLAKRITEALG